MQAVLRLMGSGFLGGVLTALVIALGDLLVPRPYGFGYRSGIIGVMTGALLQLFALGLALACYRLAAQNRSAGLRRRALAVAIWCGTAGFASGFGSLAIWALAGRPLP